MTFGIVILFLGILLGIKALDYHPLTHGQDSDAVKCELCIFSIWNESHSFDNSAYSGLPIVNWVFHDERVIDFHKSIPVEEYTDTTLFGRPPPFLS